MSPLRPQKGIRADGQPSHHVIINSFVPSTAAKSAKMGSVIQTVTIFVTTKIGSYEQELPVGCWSLEFCSRSAGLHMTKSANS